MAVNLLRSNFVNSSKIDFKNTSRHLIICTDGATDYSLVYEYLNDYERIEFRKSVFIRYYHSSTIDDIKYA